MRKSAFIMQDGQRVEIDVIEDKKLSDRNREIHFKCTSIFMTDADNIIFEHEAGTKYIGTIEMQTDLETGVSYGIFKGQREQ